MMSGANQTFGCLLIVSISLAPVRLRAADWPQWGGTLSRNMVSAEQHLPDTFSRDGENLVWTARLGAHTYGNPTVADGRVFVGTDGEGAADDPRFGKDHPGVVKCLSEKTGELLWQLVVPERKHDLPADSHFVQQEIGICSSPTVDGDRVYLMTTAAEIVCLDVQGMANGNDGPFVDEGPYMAGAYNQPGVPTAPAEVKPTDADILWRYDMLAELDARFAAASSVEARNAHRLHVEASKAPAAIREEVMTLAAPFQRILHPTDFSDCAGAAENYAVALARSELSFMSPTLLVVAKPGPSGGSTPFTRRTPCRVLGRTRSWWRWRLSPLPCSPASLATTRRCSRSTWSSTSC